MENIDQALQARVWSRVSRREDPLPPPEQPCRLLELTGELAACYRVLGMKRGGRFRGLEQQLRSAQAQLQSLQRFRGCESPQGRFLPPKGGERELLERCCHLERRLAEQLEANQSDPEWGAVFRLLARDAWQRCRITLELRGRWR